MAKYDVSAIPDYLNGLLPAEFQSSDQQLGISFFMSKTSAYQTGKSNNDPNQLPNKIEILKKIEGYSNLPTNDPSTTDDTYQEAAKFFSPYVDKHWELIRVYAILRKRFHEDLKMKETRESPEFQQRAGDLLILSSVLKGVHRHGLNVPRETRRYLDDQNRIKGYLQDVAGFEMRDIVFAEEPEPPEWGTQSIRNIHQRLNLIPRLLLVRLWRDIRLLALFVQGNFLDGFRQVEQGGALFFFSYLAWIFFLPRMLTNFALFYKHVFDKSSMTRVEQELGWKVRMRAQWVRRWDEMLNDMGWFSSGVTTCFFLAGSVPAVGIYLAIAMQAYDLLRIMVRFMIEMNRLNELKSQLKTQRQARGGANQSDMDLLCDLEERIKFDRNELFYSLFNFIILLVCAILMTPTFASISPILPIMGATIAVLITVLTFAMTRWVVQERQKRYDSELIPSALHCVKTVDKNFDIKDVKYAELGVFAAGYIRVLDDDNKLINLIYLQKKPEKKIDFKLTFNLNPEKKQQIERLLGVQENELNQFQILEEAQQQGLMALQRELVLEKSAPKSNYPLSLWHHITDKMSKNLEYLSGALSF